MSRMVFIIGALTHIPNYRRRTTNRSPKSWRSPGRRGAGPPRTVRLRDWLQQNFNSWQEWHKVMGDPVLDGWLNADVPRVPLCNAYLSRISGVECVVIDTSFDDDRTQRGTGEGRDRSTELGRPSVDDSSSR